MHLFLFPVSYYYYKIYFIMSCGFLNIYAIMEIAVNQPCYYSYFCLLTLSQYDSMSIGGGKLGYKQKLVSDRVRDTNIKMHLLTLGKI